MNWASNLGLGGSPEDHEALKLTPKKQRRLRVNTQTGVEKSSFSSNKQQNRNNEPLSFHSEKLFSFKPLKINSPIIANFKPLNNSSSSGLLTGRSDVGKFQFKQKSSRARNKHHEGIQKQKFTQQLNKFPSFNLKNVKQIKLPNSSIRNNTQRLSNVKSLDKAGYLNQNFNKQQSKQKTSFGLKSIQIPKENNKMNGFKNELLINSQIQKDKKQQQFQFDISKFEKSLRNTATSQTKKAVLASTPTSFPYRRVAPTQQKENVLKKQDFQIGKSLGKGQYGQVMIVRHKITGFICAMKVMSKKTIRQQNYINQIVRQITIHSYINHRNIAPLYGYFEDKENLYLLVEFCEGGQLYDKIKKARKMQQMIVSKIIKQVLQGIDYLHRLQIIHRDLKPQNILFASQVVKISDFGWAVFCNQGYRMTVSGSPLYYPPQIVKGQKYDEKIDLWNVGMMTYQCLLGKIPFRIYSELDLDKIVSDQITFPDYVDVSDTAKDFILRIMRKNPQQRMEIKEMLRHKFIKQSQQYKNLQQIQKQLSKIL